jgi:hypothetical protein
MDAAVLRPVVPALALAAGGVLATAFLFETAVIRHIACGFFRGALDPLSQG